MQQLRPEACLVAQELEERGNRIHILLLVKCGPLVAALRATSLPRWRESASSVAAELDPHMGEAIGEGLLQGVETLFFGRSSLVVIDGNAIARLAAEHFVNRHVGAL